MNKTSNRIGWLVAGILGCGMVASGFQDNAVKIGVVDVTSMIEKSKYGIAGQSEFLALKSAREGLLAYVNEHRIITTEQATALKELSLKPNPTEAEKAQLDSRKAEIDAAEKRNKELATKPNLTPEERTLMNEYAQRAAAMDTTSQRWYNDFMSELQTWADKRKIDSLDKARAAVQETAKAQGFTIVFEVGVAPYGANNITDAALKAMDAKG